MSPCLQSWRHFSSNARFYLLSNQRLCITLLYLWVEQHFNHGRKLVSLKEMIGMFKDTHRKNAPSNKTPVLTKSMKMDNWVVGTSNQLFSKRFLNWNKNFQKNKVVPKLLSFGTFGTLHSICFYIGLRYGCFVWKRCVFNLGSLN